MDITVRIDDAVLAPAIKDTLSQALMGIIKRTVNDRINRMSADISEEVEKYMNKHYPEETIRKMMDTEMKQLLQEKIEQINRGEY